MKISIVIITLNSENTLYKVLEAVSWADEIVIVDSGSTDKTIEIATQFGAKIVYKEFEGYGLQKRFAVEQATNDWVLCLDDDEMVTSELREEIFNIPRKNADCHGFFIPISLCFLGRVLRFGGEYKVLRLRLFDRKKGNWDLSKVHEKVIIDGTVCKLNHQILHYSYSSLADYFTKFNRYTSYAAEDLAKAGKQGSMFSVITRFPITFLKIYLLRGAILDGYPGFVWAILSAMYPVVKYAKLREMNSSFAN
ncbi:MAG: glycosyltransferase family 2 protein [Bacteroidota bacterium]